MAVLDATDLRPAPRPPARRRRMRGVAVTAVGASLPERVVDSAEIEAGLGLAAGWIERRTGIRSRHVAAAEDRLTDLAVAAGRAALRDARIEAATLDLVVVATATADELMPGAAPLVAAALGADRAGAFDVSAACTGFLTALSVGAAQVEAARADRVLVIGADLMSRVVDPADRGTAAVFADGAGAVVLEGHDGDSRLHPVVLGADGEGAGHITIPRHDGRIRMLGHDTFREAVSHLSLATEQAALAAGLTLPEIDLFVYHQANGRILTAVGERLGLDPARVLDCIGGYGNTCGATLPLALAHAAAADRLHEGDRILLGAFGAGFTWGAGVLEWGRPAGLERQA